MEGYIKLHRKILDSEIFFHDVGLRVWLWCLIKANHSERFVKLKVGRGQQVVKVGRGSFVFGRNKAEQELSINGTAIYRWIKTLEERKMITIDSNNQYSIITICKYESYQGSGEDEIVSDEQPMNSENNVATPSIQEDNISTSTETIAKVNNQRTTNEQPTNSQPTTNEQPMNTNKNDKNDKNDKKNNSSDSGKFDFKKSLIELGVSLNTATDWMQVRKTKKATNTKTSFDAIKREIEKTGKGAEYCINEAVISDWRGFKASWLENKTNNSHKQQNNGKQTRLFGDEPVSTDATQAPKDYSGSF